MMSVPQRSMSSYRTVFGLAALVALVAPTGVAFGRAEPPPPLIERATTAQTTVLESPSDVPLADPTLSLTSAAGAEGDAGTSLLHFTLSVSGPVVGVIEGVARTYGSDDDPYPDPATATSGVDYQYMNRHWSMTTANPTFDFYVAVNGDTEVEPDEFFYLQIFCEGAYICGFYNTGHILDDDAAASPTLSIADNTVDEGDVGTHVADFEVTLAPPSSSTVTVEYSTCGVGCDPNATATAGEDYEIATGVLTFLPGETSKTISVVVIGDTDVEPDEFFYVGLLDPVDATLDDGIALGTIRDDDGTIAPPVANDDTATVGYAGTVSIDVLANDANPSGYAVDIIKLSDPDHGTADLEPTGRFTYTHDGSITTIDSFTYKLDHGFGDSAPATVRIDITGVPVGAVGTMVPARLLETRSGANATTVDGLFEGIGRRGAGSTLALTVAGRGGVPVDADAVFLNVTAVSPEANGFVTVFPCGASRPQASNVNYFAGDVVPNAVLAEVGDGGKVCVYTLAATHLIADVNGYVPDGGAVGTMVPARLLETRSGANATTVDGLFEGIGRRGAGSTLALTVAGRGGVPVDADAVFLNVTAVSPEANGFVTVFPCGASRPQASNVNYFAGDVVPNAVLAEVGDGGKVCVYTLAATHLIADVNGYVPDGGAVGTMVPARLLETRSGANATTVDGLFEGIGRRGAGSTLALTVAGRGGVPVDADAVFLNVTAVSPEANGFVTVFPCGASRPQASNVNYFAGDVVPNAVLAEVGDGGKVCVYTLAATHLIADVNGYVH